MNLANIIENDVVDSDDGIAVSVWFNYCPHRCKGCHNAHLFDAVNEVPIKEVVEKLISLIDKNGVKRNLSILGGEPLAPQNLEDCKTIIKEIKKVYPDTKIYLWTGYTIEELLERGDNSYVLENINTLIEGRFILEQRDLTLKLRGSTNQRIFRNIDGILIQEK